MGFADESSQKTLYAPERLLHSFSVAENADHLTTFKADVAVRARGCCALSAVGFVVGEERRRVACSTAGWSGGDGKLV
jgi:hypothetical protein